MSETQLLHKENVIYFIHGMVCVKKSATICKICALQSDKTTAALYGLPLDLCSKCEIGYCSAFCHTRHNFCQTRRNSAKHAVFSRGVWRFTRRHTSGIASKCGAHGGISTAHGTSR